MTDGFGLHSIAETFYFCFANFLFQLLQFCFLSSWLISSVYQRWNKILCLWLRFLSATCETLLKTPAHLRSLVNVRKTNYAVPLELYCNFSSLQFRRLTIIIRLFLTSHSGATSLVFGVVYLFILMNGGQWCWSMLTLNASLRHLTDDGLSPPGYSYFTIIIYLSNDWISIVSLR